MIERFGTGDWLVLVETEHFAAIAVFRLVGSPAVRTTNVMYGKVC